jgi:hypothetical protein
MAETGMLLAIAADVLAKTRYGRYSGANGA